MEKVCLRYGTEISKQDIFFRIVCYIHIRLLEIFIAVYLMLINTLDTALPVHKKEAPGQFELQPDEEGWLKLV